LTLLAFAVNDVAIELVTPSGAPKNWGTVQLTMGIAGIAAAVRADAVGRLGPSSAVSCAARPAGATASSAIERKIPCNFRGGIMALIFRSVRSARR
jgi:hypothetical protein